MISHFGEELMPRRATEGSLGYDIISPVNMHVTPRNPGVMGYYEIDTGLCLEPDDLTRREALLILPRSGFGVKNGFYLANTMGLIDSDFTFPIRLMFNIRHGELDIRRGDRIAQFIVVSGGRLRNELPPLSQERNGGFGSTGV